jgi:hypothetical protein
MNHVVHPVHAVGPILLSTTNRAAGMACGGTQRSGRSAEQDRRNRVNSVNRVSRDRRRGTLLGDPGGGSKHGTLSPVTGAKRG